MKKSLLLTIAFLFSLLLLPNTIKAEINISDDNLYNNLKGKIILRVEAKGEAYYVHPEKQTMYYLGRPADAFQVMREQGLGITTDDLNRITTIDSVKNYGHDIYLSEKLKGKILLQVEENGEAWYVNPSDTHRYFLGRPADAFNIMRNLGIGISENDYNKLFNGYSERILDEITFENKVYRAYEDKITEVIDGIENTIFTIDKSLNEGSMGKITFINNPKLELSPSGYILFFNYWEGLDSCKKNGIQLDSKQLLWDYHIGCNATTYWSPDNKQVAFVWNHYDALNLYISNYGDIKTLTKKFEVGYPGNEEEITKYYWKSNNTFVFEPNEEYFSFIKNSFEENNLTLGTNEFITR